MKIIIMLKNNLKMYIYRQGIIWYQDMLTGRSTVSLARFKVSYEVKKYDHKICMSQVYKSIHISRFRGTKFGACIIFKGRTTM